MAETPFNVPIVILPVHRCGAVLVMEETCAILVGFSPLDRMQVRLEDLSPLLAIASYGNQKWLTITLRFSSLPTTLVVHNVDRVQGMGFAMAQEDTMLAADVPPSTILSPMVLAGKDPSCPSRGRPLL